MFVSLATEELNCVAFLQASPNFYLFQDVLTKEIIGSATKREGLYYMDDLSLGRANKMKQLTSVREIYIQLWHQHLGHPSFSHMKYVFLELFSNLHDLDFKCETCILAKSHCASFSTSLNKSDNLFTLIHSDVWEPSPMTTISRICWFMILVDDCTQMTWLYLLKHKDEVFGVFRTFHAMIQTLFSAKA